MRLHVNGKDIWKQKIDIGFEGEKNYKEIEFDFSDVFSEYPEASAYMNIKPFVGEVYPHTLTREGENLLVWNVNEADCTVPGVGMYQITFTYNNTVIKSFKGMCVVRDSIIGSADPPTPVEEWIADASAALAALENITASAENLPEGSEATAEIHTVNGHKDIHIGVPAGEKGDQGFSPVVTVTDVPGGHQVVIEDESGEHTFTVMNGEDGEDGVSPQITVTNITGGHRVSVTDASGTDTFDVMDGQDGQDGVTPDFSIGTVQTLPAGSDATASVTGTAENPVLNLGIPQGEQGDPGEIPQETLDQIEDDITDLKLNKADIIVSSASGAIASFPDGAESTAKKLVVGIEPVQDLHGYDSPWVGGAGKNVLPVTEASTTSNGVTFTINSDGTISTTGTASANTVWELAKGLSIDGTSKKLYGCPANGSAETYSLVARQNGTWMTNRDYGSGVALTSTVDRVAIRIMSGTNVSGLVFKPMICTDEGGSPTFASYKNICPITGWDGVEVTQKNLPIIYDSIGFVGGVDCVANQVYDATTGEITSVNGYARYLAFVKCTPGQTYYMSFNKSSTASRAAYVAFYNARQEFVSSIMVVNPTTATGVIRASYVAPADTMYMRFSMPYTVADSFFLSAGVEIPEDFSVVEQTYSISFPSSAGTVYGGTLTINQDGSGSLVVDRGLITIDGTETFIDVTSANVFYAVKDALSAYGVSTADDYCNMFKPVQASGSSYMSDGDIARQTTNNNRLFVKSSVFAGWTASQLATYFASNNLQICLKLATPVTYSLTANQVRTLFGYNALWADAGQVSVTYPADTKRYIDNKLAELVAQIVNS